MVCPHCRALCGDEQKSCPGCGVDFLKWARKGSLAPARAAPSARGQLRSRGSLVGPAVLVALALLIAGNIARRPAAQRRDPVRVSTPKRVARSRARPPAPLPVASTRTPAAGLQTLTLRLFHDGRPFTPPAAARLDFWTFEQSSKRGATITPRPEGDAYLLDVAGPGRYYVTARVLARREPPTYPRPGDWYGSATVGSGDRAAGSIELLEVIHLTAPADNSVALPHFLDVCGPVPTTHAGPVRFEWIPVGAGADYDYKVFSTSCPHRRSKLAASGRVSEAGVSVPLPPSAPGEYYLFMLDAVRGGRAVGKLCTFGENWNGWDYRFRVAP